MSVQQAGHTAIWQHRFAAANAVMREDEDHEWWVVHLLDTDLQILESQRLWVGTRCPPPDYQLIWQEALKQAIALGADTLFSVRYHPHQWMVSHEHVERYHWLWTTADAAGVPLRQHLHCDVTGTQYPSRIHGEAWRWAIARSDWRPSEKCASMALAAWMSICCQLW